MRAIFARPIVQKVGLDGLNDALQQPPHQFRDPFNHFEANATGTDLLSQRRSHITIRVWFGDAQLREEAALFWVNPPVTFRTQGSTIAINHPAMQIIGLLLGFTQIFKQQPMIRPTRRFRPQE